MVHIINGEIVPDDDPRVVRARQRSQAPPKRVGSMQNGDAARIARGATFPGLGTSRLQSVARQMGLDGSVTFPAVFGLPSRSVPKMHLALAAVLVTFCGWRALVFLAVAYFLSAQPPTRDVH
ncbi:hypothetical protein PsorP6_001792 [Peronosclerospora sorghi]|uniref:Uncharacterized protein n=1 Tax=Peronosclerospora sorghi TaxID=230839 RepID=A0ACC0WS46_9STRA|nr:hypothetical protein PsorP6_001792 [Peronosclerospora sorghi]